jgi:hypothetical protein
MKMRVFLFLVIPFAASAQPRYASTIEILHSFSFNDPYEYSNRPAPDEVSGMTDLLPLENGMFFIAGTSQQKYFLYDSNWQIKYSLSGKVGHTYHAQSLHYILLGNESGSEIRTIFRIVGKEDPIKVLYEVDQKGYSGTSFYLSDKIVFFNSYQGLVSWELLANRKTAFRDKNETKKWLEDGNALLYGYHLKKGEYFGLAPFGDYIDDSIIKETDFSEGISLGFVNGQSPILYIGRDRKGLFYFYSWGPDPRDYPTKDSGGYFFGVIDPWAKRAIFRPLQTGQSTPKNQTKENLGYVALPKAIDPNGNIYFFDSDVKNSKFILSRIVNDWWKELSVTGRTMGAVNDNRVRLRDAANMGSKTIGYLYENEIVSIKQESSNVDTFEGKSSPWFQVLLSDGTNGWVFGAFIDIQK